MSEPFLGEIRAIGFNGAPRGWALCDGTLLSIAQNQALFSLLGTMYGGDGRTTFALPDLRGRVPYHPGLGANPGDQGGEASHTLTLQELPAHSHVVEASVAAADQSSPTNNIWAVATGNAYGSAGNTTLAPAAVQMTGGSQPHENQPPFLVINFVIALQGIYPSRP